MSTQRGWQFWLGMVAMVAVISAIALGQMAVVYEGLTVAHPAWHPFVRGVVAIGFDLAVISVGLAVLVTGDKRLAAGELALLAVAVACGLWTIQYQGSEPPRWMVTATLAWLPLQYIIATAALHKLYHYGQQERETVTTPEVQQEATPEPDTVTPPVPATVAPTGYTVEVKRSPERKVQRKVTRKRTANPRPVVIEVATANPMASQREVARLAGTSPTTVKRMMTDGVLHRNGSGWEVVG